MKSDVDANADWRKAKRSWNMSRIRGKDTKPELMVRSILHRMGYRFRLNRKDLPGKPDIVFPAYKTVLFVHGCYWHRHKSCKNATTPANNREFWIRKFADTVQRDMRNQQDLRKMGWIVAVIWECHIRRDPVLAVTNALIDAGMLTDDTPYPTELSIEQLRTVVRERFNVGWKR
ncbi:MAG: DNA mismatch endonuclease Vsr [Deltaproteobacteria bacterium]|nr:DNA mismatch endonuclease Vsr [Deltaproteobacteria bacterium]